MEEFIKLAEERGYLEEGLARDLGTKLKEKPLSLSLGDEIDSLCSQKRIASPSARNDFGSSHCEALKVPKQSSSASISSLKGLEKPEAISSANSFLYQDPRSPETVLYLTKEGNDIRLNWTGTGSLYDCAIARDVKFQQGVETLFLDLNNTTYLYKNGLINGDPFIAFDVTDEVEQNRGGNWNGGLLPPPPPKIDVSDPQTNIGSLYIGSNGVIKGSNFSSIREENLICFEDGVCTYPESATNNRLDFKVPPGASSGKVAVEVRGQVSEPEEAKVNLEDTSQGWTIRTMSYSKQSGEY